MAASGLGTPERWPWPVSKLFKQAFSLGSIERAMRATVGSKIPIKITEPEAADLTAQLSKYREQFEFYDPSPDNPPDSELANQFVPGYEGYQRRVGEMIKKQHRRVFGRKRRWFPIR